MTCVGGSEENSVNMLGQKEAVTGSGSVGDAYRYKTARKVYVYDNDVIRKYTASRIKS